MDQQPDVTISLTITAEDFTALLDLAASLPENHNAEGILEHIILMYKLKNT